MRLGRTELAALAVIVSASATFMILERRRPYNRGQRLFREGFFTDIVWYNAVQSYLLGALIGGLIGWMDRGSGLSRLKLISGWPVALQLAFFVVTHDLYIYGMHRLMHRSPILWRIHEAHHSVHDVDWLSGVRSHALEILLNQTVEFAPIVLLGAAPQVAVWKGVVSAVWGMFIHSNLDVRLGPVQYVINGPEMHRWHHALAHDAAHRNFATKLAVWDWLFGSAFFPNPRLRKAAGYGLSEPGFPEGYFRQQAWAFRK